jgi:hypothetical protein
VRCVLPWGIRGGIFDAEEIAMDDGRCTWNYVV